MPPLAFIRRFIYRNPYTESCVFNVEEAEASKEYLALLAEVWEAGYSSGFADGDGDSYVETATVNPYREPR